MPGAQQRLGSVLSSFLLKPIINDYILPGDFPGLIRMLVLLGGAFGLSALCSFAYSRIMVHISQQYGGSHPPRSVRQDAGAAAAVF